MRLPDALRALYRIHDGQELPADAAADTTGECKLDSPSTLHGLFGGCVAWMHSSSEEDSST